MIDLGRVLRGVMSAGAMRIVTAVLSFLVIAFMARTWSIEQLGDYSALLAFFVLLQQAPLLGLHFRVTRETAARPDSLSRQVTCATALALGVALLLLLLLVGVGSALYPSHLHLAFWLVGLSLLPTGLIVAAEAVLLGQERMTAIAGVNIAENVLRTMAFLWLIGAGAGVDAVFAAFLALRVLAAAAFFLRCGLWVALDRRLLGRAALADYLRASPVFAGILLFTAGINRFDFIALSQLGTAADVGAYTVPYKIYEVTLMAPAIIVLVVYPVLARLFEDDRPAFERTLRFLCTFNVIAGLPCAVAVAALAEPIVGLLFGDGFVSTAPVLGLLVFCTVLLGLDQAMTAGLLAAHRQKLDLYVLAGTFAAYLVLLAVLIPAWGYMGAAVATFAAALVQVVLRYAFARALFVSRAVLLRLGAALVAAACMAAAVWATSGWPPPLALPAWFAVYGTVLLLLRGVSTDDLRLVRSLIAARRAGRALP